LIGLFGGSFDPPHLGHQNIIRYCVENFSYLSSIYIVPNFISPHKFTKKFTPHQILTLCELNFSEISDKVNCSDFEINQSKPSYTIDTIQYFRKLGHSNISLILGWDAYQSFDTWKEPQLISEFVQEFIVFKRMDSGGTNPFSSKYIKSTQLKEIQNPIWDFQSSLIKNKPIEEWKGLVDPKVLDQIKNWDKENG
jgi:nicotinate-nucleotide adenylyltransferase